MEPQESRNELTCLLGHCRNVVGDCLSGLVQLLRQGIAFGPSAGVTSPATLDPEVESWGLAIVPLTLKHSLQHVVNANSLINLSHLAMNLPGCFEAALAFVNSDSSSRPPRHCLARLPLPPMLARTWHLSRTESGLILGLALLECLQHPGTSRCAVITGTFALIEGATLDVGFGSPATILEELPCATMRWFGQQRCKHTEEQSANMCEQCFPRKP